MHFWVQFVMSYQPVHVLSTTCSFLGGAMQTTVGILPAYYIGWLLPEWSGTSSTPTLVAAIYQLFMQRLLKMSK
jgi:hypothetical protein